MLTRVRRLTLLNLFVIALFAMPEILLAQNSGNSSGLPVASQVAERSYYGEGAVVLLMIGAAIFGVCRSSRRV